MKRTTATALLAIASLTTAGKALAADHAVQATVPFDFTVGEKLLPSGTYTVASSASGIIEIRSSDRKISIWSAAIADGDDSKSGGRLVFDRYGDQYFLAKVLCQSADMNVHLPTSKLEKKARMLEGSLRSSGQTLVAAK